ncbi:hypothetical protein D3C78_1455060 [compost metagenome]
MRDHVERVVERRDGGNCLQRFARREDLALLAVGREIAGKNLAVILNAHLSGKREDIEGAADLVERVLLGNAELERDEIGNFLLASVKQFRGAQQDPLPLVAGQFRLEVCGNVEGLPRMFGGACRHGADHGVGVGVANFDDAIGVDLPAGDTHRLMADFDGGL